MMLLYIFVLISAVGAAGLAPGRPKPAGSAGPALGSAAPAPGSTGSPAPSPLPKDCFTKYRCFKACSKGDKLQEVMSGFVEHNCLIFLKFHPFAENFYRIRMIAAKGTNRIIFTSKGETLECAVAGDKMIAVRRRVSPDDPEVRLTDSNINIDEFMCEMEINLRKPGDELSDTHNSFIDAEVEVNVYAAPEKTTPKAITPENYCMPVLFRLPRENYVIGNFDPDKNYAKVTYNWEDETNWSEDKSKHFISCDMPEIYDRMEYLEMQPNGSTTYRKIDEFYCNKGFKMALEGQEELEPLNDDFNIRCVAKASYFCNYEPRATPNQQPLKIITEPSLDNKTEVKIRCPESHPYFVINGETISQPNITCQNYFGNMRWTYIGEEQEGKEPIRIMLTEDGPEVHCVNEKECQAIKPENLQEGSYMGRRRKEDKDLVPVCPAGGTLRVGKDAVNVTCDRTVGEYKYSKFINKTDSLNNTHNANIMLHYKATDDTIFKCEYENPIIDEDHQNTMKMVYTGLGAGGGTILLTALIVLIIFLCAKRRSKKMREKLRETAQTNSARFSINHADEEVDEVTGKERAKNKTDDQDLLANKYLQNKKAEALKIIKRSILPEQLKPKKFDHVKMQAIRDRNLKDRGHGARKFEFGGLVSNDVITKLSKELGEDPYSWPEGHKRGEIKEENSAVSCKKDEEEVENAPYGVELKERTAEDAPDILKKNNGPELIERTADTPKPGEPAPQQAHNPDLPHLQGIQKISQGPQMTNGSVPKGPQ